MISFDLSDFADFFESKGNADAGRLRRGDRERAKSYGLVDLDGDEVIDFQEKPDDPKTTLVSIACYAFPAETLPDLSTYLEETATTPTSRGGSSSGSRSAARSTRTPSTARGSTSAPPTATSTRWSTRSTVERSLPTTRSSRTPISATWSTSCRAPPSPTRRSNAPSSSRT